MTSRITELIGTTLVLGIILFLVGTSFYGGLNPYSIGTGLGLIIIIIYLLRSPEIEPQEYFGNRSPSQTSDEDPGLDLPSGGNSEGGSSGAGNSNPLGINLGVEPQNPQNGTLFQDILIEAELMNSSDSVINHAEFRAGLENNSISQRQISTDFPFSPGTNSTRLAYPLNKLLGDETLKQGDQIKITLHVEDDQGHSVTGGPLIIKGNKNNGEESTSMTDGQNLESLHKAEETAKKLIEFHESEVNELNDMLQKMRQVDGDMQDALKHKSHLERIIEEMKTSMGDETEAQKRKQDYSSDIEDIKEDIADGFSSLESLKSEMVDVEERQQKAEELTENLEKLLSRVSEQMTRLNQVEKKFEEAYNSSIQR